MQRIFAVIRRAQDQDIFDKIYWLTETPSSADFIDNCLCTSAGTRNVNFPLYFFNPKGSGILETILFVITGLGAALTPYLTNRA